MVFGFCVDGENDYYMVLTMRNLCQIKSLPFETAGFFLSLIWFRPRRR